MPALSGQGYCWTHSRDCKVAEKRREAAKRGGKMRGAQLSRATAAELRAESLDPLPEWWVLKQHDHVVGALGWIVQQVALARLDARSASAMSTALNGLQVALRDGDTQRRIETLENVLGPRRVA